MTCGDSYRKSDTSQDDGCPDLTPWVSGSDTHNNQLIRMT